MSRGPCAMQRRVLQLLADATEPMTARTIIATIYADDDRQIHELSADVYRALAGLRRRGMVERHDGDVHAFVLTPAGRAWLATGRAALDAR